MIWERSPYRISDDPQVVRKLGFTAVADPSTLLTLHDPDIYTR